MPAEQLQPESVTLPLGLDLLWGRRGHGKRGPRPGLSAEAIARAAIRVADAEGLEGDGWRAKLRMWASIQRDMLDQHSWITQMPMAAPPLAPNSLLFVEL